MVKPNTQRMFVEQLQLQNYRCFGQLTIDFDPELTVLVAPNGGGKSAVLDALATGLDFFGEPVDNRPVRMIPGRADVRLRKASTGQMEPAGSATYRLATRFFGQPKVWSGQRAFANLEMKASSGGASNTPNIAWLRTVAAVLSESADEDLVVLPLVVRYSTSRLWGTNSGHMLYQDPSPDTAPPNSRLEAYRNSLASVANFQDFLEWFRRYCYEAQREIASSVPSPHKPKLVLDAVARAVDEVIKPVTGWGGLTWDFAEDEPVAKHTEHGQLGVRRLSDGIRTMIGLVADAAHRAARLNRFLGAQACAKTPGIILIDEVDMHLHPEWQQFVLGGLRRAFPLVQFIVTTHSPQVLSTVPKKNIRVLKQEDQDLWTATAPEFSPLQKESSDALAHVMGVHPTPQTELSQHVHRYETLMRMGQGQSQEAQRLLERLHEAGFEFTDVERHKHELWTRRAMRSSGNGDD